VASSAVFGSFVTLERWHRDGDTEPIATYVEEGRRRIRTELGELYGPGSRSVEPSAVASAFASNSWARLASPSRR
jgi:hypothetical protein